MAEQTVEEQIRRFWGACQDLNMICGDYARNADLSCASLYIFGQIAEEGACTQRRICEKTLQPRQTVNSIVTGFYKKNWIFLEETPEDRRIKTIHLTREGKKIADQILPPIRQAKIQAMEAVPPEWRAAMLEGIRIYREAFRDAMLAYGTKAVLPQKTG